MVWKVYVEITKKTTAAHSIKNMDSYKSISCDNEVKKSGSGQLKMTCF